MSKDDAARHGKVTYLEVSCIAAFASVHMKMRTRCHFLPVAAILWYLDHRSLKGVGSSNYHQMEHSG